MILLVIFFKYFGFKSWQRYQAKNVVMTTSEQDFEDDEYSPAVTVCALSETQTGFRNISIDPNTLLKANNTVAQICGDLTGDAIVGCIENQTFDFTTTVNASCSGLITMESLMDRWTSEFTVKMLGMCHTLNKGGNMVANIEYGSLKIDFNLNYSYGVFIHDPNFFFVNVNPGLPFNTMTYLKENHKGRHQNFK